MTNTNVNVNNEVTEVADEPIVVSVEQKEGVVAKGKGFISRVIHSTPGKIIGAIGLVAVGAVGAMLCGALKSDDEDDVVADVDYTEFVDDEVDENPVDVTEE